MIIYKSFFKNKKTKIYMAIVTILLIITTGIWVAFKYYSNLVNQKYNENLLFYIRDNEEELNRHLYKYDIFNYKKGLLISLENFSENNVDFLINQNLEDVILYKNDELASNTVILNLQEFYYDVINDEISYIKTLNIFNTEFKIVEVFNSKYSSIEVPADFYEKIVNKGEKIYTFNLKNVFEKDELFKRESNLEINVSENYKDNLQYESYLNAENVVKLLKYVLAIIYLLLIIVLLITICNIANDEWKEMTLEWLLGYSAIKIKQIIFLKISLLLLLSFVIIFVLFSFLNLVDVNITINNSLILLKFAFLEIILLLIVIFRKYSAKGGDKIAKI